MSACLKPKSKHLKLDILDINSPYILFVGQLPLKCCRFRQPRSKSDFMTEKFVIRDYNMNLVSHFLHENSGCAPDRDSSPRKLEFTKIYLNLLPSCGCI